MNYKKTLDYLFNSLPMYQRMGKAAYKANLDNTNALDAYFNHPHKAFKSIHIAGTNGKGSVSHILAAVFQQHGYKTGLYTSPHLFDFRERIKINGIPIAKSEVVEFVDRHKDLFNDLQPSFFEMTVALAFKSFQDHNVDVAIVETGMGGRLDSTNILTPRLSVITNIGLDHTQFLGQTLRAIAGEKAGIIKPGIPVIIGETHPETEPVFKQKADELNSPIIFADTSCSSQIISEESFSQTLIIGDHEYKTDLTGGYQRKNIATALTVLDQLNQEFNFNEHIIKKALASVKTLTGLRGRWDVVSEEPTIICDTCHNEAGVKELVKQLKAFGSRKIHLITGMVNDKDPDAILSQLPADAAYYFTKAQIERAMPENVLRDHAKTYGLSGEAFEQVSLAIEAAKQRAKINDVIIITGSIFLIANALSWFDSQA